VKIELGFLETRVARRLFTRFIISAVLPIGVLAAISYATVTENLRTRSDQRLNEVALATERAVRDRLDRADSDLHLLAQVYEATRGELAVEGSPAALLGSLPRPSGFTDVALDNPEAPQRDGNGREVFPTLTPQQKLHLRSGRSALVEVTSGGRSELFLSRALHGDPDNGVLWAHIDRAYLWETSARLSSLPEVGGMCVLNATFAALHGPTFAATSFGSAVRAAVESREPGQFKWKDGSEPMRSVSRSIILGPDFASPDWHVVVNVPERAILAPLAAFTRAFLPIVLAAFLVVLLLSDSQIRRTIRPLLRLHEATRRMAEEDFAAHVDVVSRDEFQDLAQSFNTMAGRLGKQFQTLTAVSRIDRAGLAATEARPVIETSLHTLLDLVDCGLASICLPDSDEPNRATAHTVSRESRAVTVVHTFALGAAELDGLRGHEHILLSVDARDRLPSFLRVPPFNDVQYRRFLVLPLEPEQPQRGVLCFACTAGDAFAASEIARVRQVTDQTALALSNVRRLSELSRLNLGTLKALARTIDASSPWTAGHSERVTRIAVAVGARMGLGDTDLDLLERGSLLHDIGKIGVPVEVLNKPGALTDEEFAVIQSHVTTGERILEPIHAYSDLLPVVRSHHERVDGRGYPDGLKGDGIDLRARIVAVADTFDALTSDRPYRKGLPMRTAVEVVKNAAGSQLDPAAVAAFMELVDEDCEELYPDDEPEVDYDALYAEAFGDEDPEESEASAGVGPTQQRATAKA